MNALEILTAPKPVDTSRSTRHRGHYPGQAGQGSSPAANAWCASAAQATMSTWAISDHSYA